MKNAIFLLLPALTLLYFPLAFEEFEQPKAFALIAFACFSAFWVSWKRLLSDRVAQTLLLFVLSAAVSSYFSIDWHLSVFGNIKCRDGLLVIASYLVFYLAVAEHAASEDVAQATIDVFLACSVVVASYGIAQVMGYDFKQWNGMLKEINYTRPMSSLGHPNFMANYLAMTLPFALWRLGKSRQILQKAIYAAMVVLFVSVICLSLSRGMIIAAIVGALVYFLHSKTKHRNILYFVLAIALTGALLLAISPRFRETAIHRMTAIVAPGPARVEYPRAAIKIWKRYPWFGIGTDAYELGFQHQRTPYYWRVERAGSPHRAHNDFLNILATQGIFGALTALLLTAAIMARALASKSIFAAPATASIVVFYIAGLTSFFIVATGTLFLLCAVLLEAKEA